MALTGNTVQSTYLDLVQLEQSGAGLPSHAGKEAALYDGSGAQIVGRSAVRHWLDPHPDAASFAETWEFSTTGDMTQGQLETAGWTFSECTAVVANGLLILTATDTHPTATLSVSFTGDFDVVLTPVNVLSYQSNYGAIGFIGGLKIGDAGGSYYNAGISVTTASTKVETNINGATANKTLYGSPCVIRISRVSGTVYLTGSQQEIVRYLTDDTDLNNAGWATEVTASDADTMTILRIQASNSNSSGSAAGQKLAFASIRRFQ